MALGRLQSSTNRNMVAVRKFFDGLFIERTLELELFLDISKDFINFESYCVLPPMSSNCADFPCLDKQAPMCDLLILN